jgi:uncharacterized protein YifE (UPF0438 family)
MNIIGNGQTVIIKEKKTDTEWVRSLSEKRFVITSIKKITQKNMDVIIKPKIFYTLSDLSEKIMWESDELDPKTGFNIYGRIIWING